MSLRIEGAFDELRQSYCFALSVALLCFVRRYMSITHFVFVGVYLYIISLFGSWYIYRVVRSDFGLHTNS